MSGILCPIRGGPGSQPAIELGILLAESMQERLHFLYVVNLDFLKATERGRTHVLSEEMRGMGEFILLTALTKAETAGIEADGTVRQGHIMDEIIAMAKEMEASHIILGRPREEEEDVFTIDRLEAFIRVCEQETGSKVVLADQGGEV